LAVKSGIISNLIPETTKPIAIHPWTSDPLKQWPEDRFRGLVEKLLGSGERIVIIGGIEEAGRSRELFEGLQDKVTDLTGKTDLLQLAALLKRCRLLISGDSGPVHLATCVGIPVLALFRNDLIGKTAKRWGPWSKSGFVIEKSRLEDISVEEVLTKAREILR
jgi:ADP-heptose:LPS heptosyltransferase